MKNKGLVITLIVIGVILLIVVLVVAFGSKKTTNPHVIVKGKTVAPANGGGIDWGNILNTGVKDLSNWWNNRSSAPADQATTDEAYAGCNADGTSATGDGMSNVGFDCTFSPNYTG